MPPDMGTETLPGRGKSLPRRREISGGVRHPCAGAGLPLMDEASGMGGCATEARMRGGAAASPSSPGGGVGSEEMGDGSGNSLRELG